LRWRKSCAVPDYYARYPKPCAGGWARRSPNVTPTGKVLPFHAAESIAGLEFWSVRDHSLVEIWANSPAFNEVPAMRAGFRRLSLPGLHFDRRRGGGPGMPTCLQRMAWWRYSRQTPKTELLLSAHVTAAAVLPRGPHCAPMTPIGD
jgi:hypothetical protein